MKLVSLSPLDQMYSRWSHLQVVVATFSHSLMPLDAPSDHCQEKYKGSIDMRSISLKHLDEWAL